MRMTRFGPDVRQIMKGELRRLSKPIRAAVAAEGKAAQEALRSQARAAGFKDKGKALANAWRLSLYPAANSSSDTLRPAAMVWSKMPRVVDAFDRGAIITARKRKYLAIPTAMNAPQGRRSKLRMTPSDMLDAQKRGEALMIPLKKARGSYLWCLKVFGGSRVGRRLASGKLARTTRIKLFVGKGTEILTGNRKGAEANRKTTLARGSVPMFLLMRRVRLQRRLDTDGIRKRAEATLPGRVKAAINAM